MPRLPRILRAVNFFYCEWRNVATEWETVISSGARVLAREGLDQREGAAMKLLPAVFEEGEIRRVYDEKSETWFFSVVDIVQVLTQQHDFQSARYWNKLKERLRKEGSQS